MSGEGHCTRDGLGVKDEYRGTVGSIACFWRQDDQSAAVETPRGCLWKRAPIERIGCREESKTAALTAGAPMCIIHLMGTPTKRTNLFIEPELWRALRVRAIEEGTTATGLLNRLIAAYLGQKPAAQPPKKQTPQKRRA
jgi:hypothetical protein